jgi:anti-sigma B factor antagonist
VNELARVESEQRGSLCLVRVYGEIDMSNDRDVLTAIEVAVARETDRLVVDLTNTTYLDSAGLALLLRLAERMQARQQLLSVVVPVDSRVRRAFELTGLLSVIDVVSRSEDALSETRPGSSNDKI